MKYIVAAFPDADDRQAAETALREAGLTPEEPDVDNPFFDPTASMPESRGLLWGGLFGGVLGAILLASIDQYVLWIPRISPIMTAGSYALVALGFGLGAATGGFLGGVAGTLRATPTQERHRLAVVVPDHRVGEAESLLRENGATAVDGVVTHHRHPLADRVAPSEEGGAE